MMRMLLSWLRHGRKSRRLQVVTTPRERRIDRILRGAITLLFTDMLYLQSICIGTI
jgi:hypothetical protein